MCDPDDFIEWDVRLGNMNLPYGTSENTRNILSRLLIDLQNVLRNNPYIQDFISACELNESEFTRANLIISADARPQGTHSRVYNRGFKEISVLIDDQNGGPRDIQLKLRSGGLKTIADTHRSYDALHFVLLYPKGICLS